ncbi:MAG: hypothetical protein VYA34_01070 [Myxococcota bacterium]|nr:hypothetical protein [Myxococcota bacterium]
MDSSEPKPLILSGDLESFFKEEVSDASSKIGVSIPETIEYYLVNLLCEYSSRQVEPLHSDEPLAFMYKRALEATTLEQMSLLKDLGDQSLYLAGFFEEYVCNSLVDTEYYIAMGGQAYSSLRTVVKTKRSGSKVGYLYGELARTFGDLVGILNYVSDTLRRSTGDEGLLKLYARWMDTGCPKLHKELLEQGLLTSFGLPDDAVQ